jgi:acetylornithine deacetylase/succinyl-diaminopimelate desuccinylase-like protein
VPVDPDHWSVDPFAGEIRDGMLWGRGAVDMKDMDAMILTALREMRDTGQQPHRDLIVAFFADEENGGNYGSHHVVTQHPELFAGATEAISEVGGYSVTIGDKRAYLLQTGEKALIWATLTARGTAAHGSRVVPDNAVTKLAEAVVKLGREQWLVEMTRTTTALVAAVADILGLDPTGDPREIIRATGLAAGFLEPSLSATSNPTQLSAGYKHNVIPDSASAAIDIRPLPGTEDSVLARVRDIVGPDIEVSIATQDIGLENSFDAPIVDAMAKALRAQANAQIHLHVLRIAIRHGIKVLKQLGHQAQPETGDLGVGADAGLVVVKAHIGVQTRHAHIDARHARHITRVGLDEPSLVQDLFGQLDDVDVVLCAHKGVVG